MMALVNLENILTFFYLRTGRALHAMGTGQALYSDISICALYVIID